MALGTVRVAKQCDSISIKHNPGKKVSEPSITFAIAMDAEDEALPDKRTRIINEIKSTEETYLTGYVISCHR